jgi:hypothetical protein
MSRRPANVLRALALMALGILAARAVDAQVPPPPPPPSGNSPNPPHDNNLGMMATIPRSTAFFIASVEIAVIVAAVVVGIVLPTRPPAPTSLPPGQPVTPDDRKRPLA